MSIAERSSRSKRSLRMAGLSESVLLVIVAFVFLALHVRAGVLADLALPHEPTEEREQMAAAYGD